MKVKLDAQENERLRNEFLQSIGEPRGVLGPTVQEAFESLDEEKKGYLTLSRVQRMFQRADGSCLGEEGMRKIAESFSCDNGVVTREQFENMFNLYKDHKTVFFDMFDDNDKVYFQSQDSNQNYTRKVAKGQYVFLNEEEAENGSENRGQVDHQRVSEAERKFAELDTGNTGFLTLKQLKEAFELHDEVIDVLIRQFAKSANQTGVNKEEFVRMFYHVKTSKQYYCECFADGKNYPAKLVHLMDISQDLAEKLCEKFTLLDKLNHPSQSEELELIVDDYIVIEYWIDNYLDKVFKGRRLVSLQKIEFIMISLGLVNE